MHQESPVFGWRQQVTALDFTGPGRDQLRDLAWRMLGESSPLPHLRVLGQHPVHRRHRGHILATFEEDRVDLQGGLSTNSSLSSVAGMPARSGPVSLFAGTGRGPAGSGSGPFRRAAARAAVALGTPVSTAACRVGTPAAAS